MQWLIDTGLEKSDYTYANKEWFELYHSKINTDILIQGSSRAKLHISPIMLENALNLHAYNIGIMGSSFPIQNYMFKEYLKHNKKPKYIIQSIDVGIFDNPEEQFDFKQFIPYLNQNFLEHFEGHSIFTKKDLYIPLYKYTHSFGAVTAGLMNLFNQKPVDNGHYKGFFSINQHYDNTLFLKRKRENPDGFRSTINPNGYKDFQTFIDLCNEQNIKLFLVCTPILIDFQNLNLNQDSIINMYAQTAKSKNVIFLNYRKDRICKNRDMFADYLHLNNQGVKVFNEKLIHDFKLKTTKDSEILVRSN